MKRQMPSVRIKSKDAFERRHKYLQVADAIRSRVHLIALFEFSFALTLKHENKIHFSAGLPDFRHKQTKSFLKSIALLAFKDADHSGIVLLVQN